MKKIITILGLLMATSTVFGGGLRIATNIPPDVSISTCDFNQYYNVTFSEEVEIHTFSANNEDKTHYISAVLSPDTDYQASGLSFHVYKDMSGKETYVDTYVIILNENGKKIKVLANHLSFGYLSYLKLQTCEPSENQE